jgi:hypothetical protein
MDFIVWKFLFWSNSRFLKINLGHGELIINNGKSLSSKCGNQ